MIYQRLFGFSASVERELVCPRCRTIERVKTTIGLALLVGILLAAVIGTIVVI